MMIWSSISLELDEDIVYIKRVKLSWYESDFSSNRGGIYRVGGQNLIF
jgi:hypothetical protein